MLFLNFFLRFLWYLKSLLAAFGTWYSLQKESKVVPKFSIIKKIFFKIKKIASLVHNNFVNGSAKITSFTIVYNKTFDVIEGNNSMYFPPKTAILSPTDYLFVESLDDAQIAAYKSSLSDYIWSNNTLKYIDNIVNYQLSIQFIIEDHSFTKSFNYNYSYDHAGIYTLSVQAGSLNKSQSVTVSTSYTLFLLINLFF
jgi:hypothetical protein